MRRLRRKFLERRQESWRKAGANMMKIEKEKKEKKTEKKDRKKE